MYFFSVFANYDLFVRPDCLHFVFIVLEDMYTALTTRKHLDGISVYHAEVLQSTAPKGSMTTIKNVAQYGHFQYDKDGIRLFKYFGIGEGLLFTKHPCSLGSTLRVLSSGGFKGDVSTFRQDRASLQRKQRATFWHWRPDTLKTEEPENSDGNVTSETTQRSAQSKTYCIIA